MLLTMTTQPKSPSVSKAKANRTARAASNDPHAPEDIREAVTRLNKTGLVDKEKVLRSEVQLAQAKRAFEAVDAAAATALSALNLSIGLNVNSPTEVISDTFVPPEAA